MKKRKAVLIAVFSVLVIAAGVALYTFSPVLLMSPAGTGQIPGTNIFAVRNVRNAVYFLETSDGTVLVDTGSDPDELKKSMEENNIAVNDVKWILLTHSDYDHVGSVGMFPDAEVIGPDVSEHEFTLGSTNIKCIETPGHRANHKAYLVDDKYLFTGDAFRRNGKVLSIHPFSDDREESERSIERLKKLTAESELTLTGHYGYFKSESE